MVFRAEIRIERVALELDFTPSNLALQDAVETLTRQREGGKEKGFVCTENQYVYVYICARQERRRSSSTHCRHVQSLKLSDFCSCSEKVPEGLEMVIVVRWTRWPAGIQANQQHCNGILVRGQAQAPSSEKQEPHRQ